MWLLLACKQPDPAPRDLDALAHDLWAHYATEDADALVADLRDLRGIVDEDELPMEGTFTDLTEDEAGLVDVDRDPAPALGMFTIGFVGCSPADLERVLYATNQDELYPDNYVSYQRAYTSNFDAYEARTTPHLTWDTDYEVDVPLFGAYAAAIHGGQHFAPDGDDGPYLLSRTVMPEPADGDPDTVVLDVDLQIEAYYPHDGGMVHLFGMWRHIDLGGGFGTDDPASVGLIVDGMIDWDDKTTEVCEEGRI